MLDAHIDGVDQLGEKWARSRGVPVKVVRPDYANAPGGNRRAAPLARNKLMIDEADGVCVFWDGESKGTAHVVREAKKQDKLLGYHTYDW